MEFGVLFTALLQADKSPSKRMPVLGFTKCYKEASRAMFYYVNCRHINVMIRKHALNLVEEKGVLEIYFV